MTDRPIIFSAPMVRALLEDRKTMTRRLAWRGLGNRLMPKNGIVRVVGASVKGLVPSPWQRVKPGDRLWVRETHYRYGRWVENGKTNNGQQRWRFRLSAPAKIPDNTGVYFQTEIDQIDVAFSRTQVGWHKRPSIFMPRWASRLTLTVTATKIDRVQSISEADATAEGIYPRGPEHPFGLGATEFGELWRSLHGPDSWAANPEVVALTFTVHKQNIDETKEDSP